MTAALRRRWAALAARSPGTAQFVLFFVLSNGVTVLQLAIMPLLKAVFGRTSLVSTSFQFLPIGTAADGSRAYLFDYAAGALPHGGGGLAYFLAVQIAILVAQVVNFFAQRSVTFRSTGSVRRAALWYAIAYVLITIGAAALQLSYKGPVYDLFMETWGWGSAGETVADIVTMIINSTVSFWVFFPIFRLIFRDRGAAGPGADGGAGTASGAIA